MGGDPNTYPSGGVEFEQINENSTQAEAESKVRLAMLQLSAQSFDLYEKYAVLKAELKRNNGPWREIEFADGMERTNKVMSNNLINSQNVDYTKSYIRSGINSIISSMGAVDYLAQE